MGHLGCFIEIRVSKVMAEVVGLLRIPDIHGPYLPQRDGQVERFSHTLGAMLVTVVTPDQMDWDLPFLTVVYRATKHPATEFSPN